MTTTIDTTCLATRLRALADMAEKAATRSDHQQVARAMNVLSMNYVGEIKAMPGYHLESADYRRSFESAFGL